MLVYKTQSVIRDIFFSGWNNLGSNFGVGYQQPGYSSGYNPSYASSFGYQQPDYLSSFNYHQPNYGSGFDYYPQVSTSSHPLTYQYKYYNKYFYPNIGYNQQTTPEHYSQNYYSVPSYSSHGLQTHQPYTGSYLYSSTYQQPQTSSYSNLGSSNFQQSQLDNSYQHFYQSYPSTSSPASTDYSFHDKNDNSYLSSGLGNSQ